jgi:hypothetical protein
MTGVNMTDSDVAGASFRDVRFIRADLSGMHHHDLANFTGACSSIDTLMPPGLLLPLCGDVLIAANAPKR